MQFFEWLKSQGIPDWLLMLMALSGPAYALWSLCKAFYELIFHTPTIEIRLIKDVFIRFTENGEILFPNVVLLARFGEVEINGFSFTLTKIGRETKVHPVKIMSIGEKSLHKDDVFARHGFLGPSPKMFLNKNTVERKLFYTCIENYNEKAQSEVAEFNKKMNAIKKKINDNSEWDYVDEAVGVVNDTYSRMMGYVQLGEGKYKLEVEVKYRPVDHIINKEKTKTSYIEFEIRKDYDEVFRPRMRDELGTAAKNLLLGTSDQIVYPEYLPFDIREDGENQQFEVYMP